MNLKTLLQQYLDFVKTHIPEPRGRSSVGIDIGSSSCKMVELKGRAGAFELVQWGIEPVLDGDPAPAVSKLLSRVSGSAGNAPVTAVQGKGTLIRHIELPRMSAQDLRKSFDYEVDKYLPFTADQIYLDSLILDPAGKSGTMTVMAAAARREIVDERIAFLKGVGVEADRVTLNAIALGNIISVLDGGQKTGACVVVDIGARVSSVNVICEGLPRFTRDIFIGGMDVTGQIARSLGVSMEEAERLKCSSRERQDEIVKAAEPVMMNLIADTRMSLDYFMNSHTVPVGGVFLSGGGARLEGLVEMFQGALELDVLLWDPFTVMTVADGFRQEVAPVSGQLATALGLALNQ